MTQARPCSEKRRSSLIAGNATLTTVASRTTMNCATATTARTALGSPREAGRDSAEVAEADMRGATSLPKRERGRLGTDALETDLQCPLANGVALAYELVQPAVLEQAVPMLVD